MHCRGCLDGVHGERGCKSIGRSVGRSAGGGVHIYTHIHHRDCSQAQPSKAKHSHHDCGSVRSSITASFARCTLSSTSVSGRFRPPTAPAAPADESYVIVCQSLQ